jgi:hypothetical protein
MTRRDSSWWPRGPLAPLVVWGVAYTASLVVTHGWQWWVFAVGVGLPALGVLLGLAANAIKARRATSRHRKHPYWVD